MLVTIIVGALFGFYFGCCTSNDPVQVRTDYLYFVLSASYGSLVMAFGVSPLVALCFGGSILIAAIGGALLPERFRVKAFLRG
jgi:hypothetical protein